MTEANGTDDLIEVQLLHLPIRMQHRGAEHHDALVRELTLIRASSTAGSLPDRLLALTEELHGKFGAFAEAPRAAIEAAFHGGEEYVDVTYRVPREAATAVSQLTELLDEVDEYCRTGQHLVTPATPPDLVAYRHWTVAEFKRQIDGHPPRPWALPVDMLVTNTEWPTAIDGECATVQLQGELDLATAPELRDHLSHLYAHGTRTFVLDSSKVSFIDSVGLSVILALYRRCREEDGGLVIKSPSRVMHRTLEVAGLYDVLDVVD